MSAGDGAGIIAGAPIGEWTETWRGAVAPWECDVTEHFTIAYYLDRVDQAAATLADRLGVADSLRAGGFPRRFDLRFAHELRAGDSFHVDSAAIGIEPELRLGHRIVDSSTGETATWVDEHWDLPASRLTPERRQAIGGRLALWQGPAAEPRSEPRTMAGAIPSARGRVKPGDLDEFGRFSLAAFVHRFTDALLQAAAAIGMTAASPPASASASSRGTCSAPADLERRNRNLVGGDVGGGSYRLRRSSSCGAGISPYRTPLRGLYLGSAAAFPGGAVHGVPGDQAARAALRDRRRGLVARTATAPATTAETRSARRADAEWRCTVCGIRGAGSGSCCPRTPSPRRRWRRVRRR